MINNRPLPLHQLLPLRRLLERSPDVSYRGASEDLQVVFVEDGVGFLEEGGCAVQEDDDFYVCLGGHVGWVGVGMKMN